MEGIKYPYLGKNTVSGKTFVVFFIAPDTGVVIMSDFEKEEKFGFGKYFDNFAEELFEVLPPDMQVSLHN